MPHTLAATALAGRHERLVLGYSSLGHALMHYMAAFFPYIAVGMAASWGEPGESLDHQVMLLPLWQLAAFLIGLGALPAGWLGDRWSVPGMMVVMFFGMGAAAIACAFVPDRNFLLLEMAMAALGLFAAIYHAVGNGARVINLSLGFPNTGSPDPTTGQGCTEIPGLNAALQYAYDHNVVVVAASGNDGGNVVNCPAAYSTTIAVGATRFDGQRTSYSTGGNALDIVAPGGTIANVGVHGVKVDLHLERLWSRNITITTRPSGGDGPHWPGELASAPTAVVAQRTRVIHVEGPQLALWFEAPPWPSEQ